MRDLWNKTLGLFILAGLSVSLSPADPPLFASTPRPTPDQHSNETYLGFHLGGDISAKGYEGKSKKMRGQLRVEFGQRYYALPLTFSYRPDVMVIGFKPRGQLLLRPVKSQPKLTLSPGIGPLFNYWIVKESLGDISSMEFGVHFSCFAFYDLTEQLSLAVTPLALDINFYRRSKITVSGSSQTSTTSDTGTVYTGMLGIIYRL